MRRRDEAVNPGRNADPADFLPLPPLPYHVLLALAEEPRHGWAIIKAIESLAGAGALPSSGSLYVAIARLEERGLIRESRASVRQTDDRRRVYELTPLGRRVATMESARLAELVGAARRWLGPLRTERDGSDR